MFDDLGNRKYLNAEESAKFLKAAKRLQALDRRTFCLTLYHSGCRISEALNLTSEQIDFSGNRLVFRTLKQRSERRFRGVPVPKELLVLLRKQTASQSKPDRLWGFSRVTGWNIIKTCMNEVGIDGVKATPRGLRHAYAIACVKGNIPLSTLQRWLGHTNAKTTNIYLDFTGEDELDLAKKLWKTRA